MSRILVEHGIEVIKASRALAEGLLAGVPNEGQFHQPIAGANHPLWIMGHLGTVDEYFLKFAGEQPTRKFDEWKGTFFAKSTPTANAADYPPLDDVRDYFRSAREALVGWFDSFDDEKLAAPLPGRLAGFLPSHRRLLAHLAWHEGMHCGQLTVVRKSLGLKPVAL